jgi:hypothetical protein
MKIQKVLATIFLMLGVCTYTFCQDLHIYYDKVNDVVRFESNGKTLKNPKVNKGANVYLHVQNYNNYLYKANVKVDNIAINPPGLASGNPLTGLLPAGGVGGTNFNLLDMGVSKLKKGLIGLIDRSDNSADGDILGFGGKEDEEDIFGFIQIEEEFTNTLNQIESIENEFRVIGEEVKKELDSKKIRDIALEEINKLKHNPDLSPSQIKKLSNEYFDKVFKEKEVSEINLDEVLAMGDIPAQMSKNLKKLKIKSNEFAQAEKDLIKLEDRTGEMLGFASSEFTKVREQFDETYGFIKVVKEAVKEDMKVLEELATDDSDIDLRRITALRSEFEIMEENDFSKTFRVQATEDIVSFNLSFSTKDSIGQNFKSATVSDIKIPVAGGLKIHPSLGVSFGQFFDTPEEFFVKDNQIVASESGAFVPIITSFLHFYRQSAKGASFGGSFGIGFPVTSSGNNQSLFFLIGPSIVMGKDSKIVFSGGIMGGKVNRLSAGYQVGDAFMDNAAIIPTSSKYELGYFFGLSYNLGN